MQHPDEGTIHAWLDGQLGVDEARELETHIGICADCAAAVAEARGLVAAASRILTKLDDVPAGVLPAGTAATRPVFKTPAATGKRGWWNRPAIQAAAGIVVVVGGSWLVLREQPALKERATLDTAVDTPALVMSAPPAVAASPRLAVRAAQRGGSGAGPALAKKLSVVPNEAAAKAVQNTPRVADEAVIHGSKTSSLAASATASGSATGNALASAPPTLSTQSGAASGVTGFRSSETRRAAADMSLESRRVSRYTPIINIPGLRVVSSDTLDDPDATRRTIYELRPGVEVTLLTARDGNAFSRTPRQDLQLADKASGTLAWRSTEYGANLKLSGNVSAAELEAIRKQIP